MLKRLALVVACLVVATATPAVARDDPYFESHSDGSPVDTLQGQWTTEPGGRAIHLEIMGGHLSGTKTWFRAGWVSPFTPKGQEASFEMTYDFSAFNIGKKMALTSRFRWQQPGRPWSSWHRHPHSSIPYEDTLT